MSSWQQSKGHRIQNVWVVPNEDIVCFSLTCIVPMGMHTQHVAKPFVCHGWRKNWEHTVEAGLDEEVQKAKLGGHGSCRPLSGTRGVSQWRETPLPLHCHDCDSRENEMGSYAHLCFVHYQNENLAVLRQIHQNVVNMCKLKLLSSCNLSWRVVIYSLWLQDGFCYRQAARLICDFHRLGHPRKLNW